MGITKLMNHSLHSLRCIKKFVKITFLVLKNILNISDIKSATDIKYVEGVSGLDGLMAAAKNPVSAAFCLFAVTKEDLIKISDAGGVLPPKSTWFEPRMKNAMIIKEF